MKHLMLFESFTKKYEPSYIYDYINDLHKKGWEDKEYEDKEWIMSHDYFILKEVDLSDQTIKWNWGQHPPVISKYSKLETEQPPIVIGSNNYIIDGTHRAGTSKSKGDDKIKAFVGVN